MSDQKIKIGVLQFNPQTLWRKGGGELHAEKYVELGNSNDFLIERFNFSKPYNYDIIHYFGSNHQLHDFGKFAQSEGIKVVGTPILFPSTNILKYKFFLSLSEILPFPTTLNLRKEILLRSDILIANSMPESEYISAVYDVSPSKISVLGTGVDSTLINYIPSRSDLPESLIGLKSYIVMVGRVTPLKNQLEVATNWISDKLPFLVIIGKPDLFYTDYCTELENIVTRNKKIIWIDSGLESGSRNLMAAYHYSVLHLLWSKTEVAALVNFEAAACRTLIISKNHITTSSIWGSKAFLARNIPELFAHIFFIINLSGVERRERIEEVHSWVSKNYSWRKIVEESQFIYKKLISNG